MSKITIDQAAKELGISRRGVRRLISTGQLRAYKIGIRTGTERDNRAVRVDSGDLAAVMHEVVPSGAK